jgi:hypothetical protein
MKINLFSVPIFIGNIDTEKIRLENETFKQAWLSETTSSYNDCQNIKLDDDSVIYLLENISKLLKQEIKNSFELTLKNIWSNKYNINDYQEEHIHSSSHFSFVIYKNVKKSKTVFVSPWKDLICAYEMNDLFYTDFNVECRSNQICVFPSFMKHMVLKNNFPSETISGNIYIKVKYA